MSIWEKFDVKVDEIEVDENMEAIPAGDYPVVFDDHETTTSKAGNPMVKITWKVEGKQHNGRLIWDHVVMNNEVSVKIFLQKIIALGFTEKQAKALTGFSKLHGKKAMAKVSVRKQEGYSDSNEIKKLVPLKAKVVDIPEVEDSDIPF